jgi:hypothetical protein
MPPMTIKQVIKSVVPKPLLLAKRRLFRRKEGEAILRERFRRVNGYDLPAHPRTFNEKLSSRLIDVNRNGNSAFARLADKYLVREYVASTIGRQYLVPLIWSGVDSSKIPFDHLPGKYVAKTNHGSGGGIVIDPGIDHNQTISMFRDQLAQNFYWEAREYHYYGIKPRLLIEEFIDDGELLGPLDYRCWCFHGKVEAIQPDNHAHTMNAFYTPSWELMGASYRTSSGIREAKRPPNLEKLIAIASKLSGQFDFVRVDLYNVKGRIYFGEFTFTPAAGFHKFDPPEWDTWFGEKWR